MLIACFTTFFTSLMLISVSHCLRLMMLFIENLVIIVLCNVLVSFIFYVVWSTFLIWFLFFLSVSVSLSSHFILSVFVMNKRMCVLVCPCLCACVSVSECACMSACVSMSVCLYVCVCVLVCLWVTVLVCLCPSRHWLRCWIYRQHNKWLTTISTCRPGFALNRFMFSSPCMNALRSASVYALSCKNLGHYENQDRLID